MMTVDWPSFFLGGVTVPVVAYFTFAGAMYVLDRWSR